MVKIRIPGSSKVFFAANHSGDLVLDMADFPDTDGPNRYESIPVIGKWTDFTGSGGVSTQQAMNQGIENELAFDIQTDDHFNDVNEVGERRATHRLRNKEIYIENVGTN